MKNIKLSPDGTDVAATVATDALAVISAAAPFAPLAGPYGEAALVAATGALDVYKALVPLIQSAINNGVITPDQQAALALKFSDVAVTHATAFKGPEWKQD